MNMRIDTTGCDNAAFAGNSFRTRSDENIHARLHIGVAGFTDTGNASIFNSDIGFYDSPIVQN